MCGNAEYMGDLRIKSPFQFTREHRKMLENALIKEFGNDRDITNNLKIHTIHGDSGKIDLLPNDASYFPSSFIVGKIERTFARYHTGRHAVRILKLFHENYPGFKIEEMVLEAVKTNHLNLHQVIF